MDKVNAWLKVLDQWHAYVTFCADAEIRAPACRSFWLAVMIALFVFGGLVALWIAWRVISYRLKYAAALRAEAARQHVDHGAISAARWDGDKPYKGDISEEEINRRIREAVHERRHATPEGKDKLNVV